MNPISQPFRFPFRPVAWIAALGLFGVGLALVVSALHAQDGGGDDAGAGNQRPPPGQPVFVSQAQEEVVENRLRVTGTMRAVRETSVASQEAGRVVDVLVDEGDLVEAGQTLVRLDHRRISTELTRARARIQEMEANLVQRKAERDRAAEDLRMNTKLWESGSIAESIYLDVQREKQVADGRVSAAEANLTAAKQERQLLEIRLTDTEVTAPFSGRVTAVMAESGEWLNTGAPVVSMYSDGPIEAWLTVPERLLENLLAADAKVEIAPRHRTQRLTADRITVVQNVSERNRTFSAIARIEASPGYLVPGMSVVGWVPAGETGKRLLVHKDAVIRQGATSHIFAVRKQADGSQIAEQVGVEVLFMVGDRMAISAPGVSGGDTIVVEGNERLRPNAPVSPIPFETQARDVSMDGTWLRDIAGNMGPNGES